MFADRDSGGGASLLPDPLGLTCAEFVAAYTGRLGASTGRAAAAYERIFRRGDFAEFEARTGVPLRLAPIARVVRSPSPEGEVLKFVQRVGEIDRGASPRSAMLGLFTISSRAGRPTPNPPTPNAPMPIETESVLIPMIGKSGVRTYTLCVSSQVGCAMGCTFCETAQMGLIRSLTAGEIVGQYLAARHHAPRPAEGTANADSFSEHTPASGEPTPARGTGVPPVPTSSTPLSFPSSSSSPSHSPSSLSFLDTTAPTGILPKNIVFMGMGEPMDNLGAVVQAIAVLTDHRGCAVPMSKITVSTVGRVDGIRELAEHVRKPGWHRLNLAVSINAPNDEVRSRIMPINRGTPMAELRRAIADWPIFGGAKICLEYVLIPGVNDADSQARELAAFARGLPVCVNVIPYNPRRGSPWPAPTEASVDRFLGWLIHSGVFAKRRRTKGRDTMAACGQLGNEQIRRRKLVAATARAREEPFS